MPNVRVELLKGTVNSGISSSSTDNKFQILNYKNILTRADTVLLTYIEPKNKKYVIESFENDSCYNTSHFILGLSLLFLLFCFITSILKKN